MGLGITYQRLRDPDKVLIYDSEHFHHDHVVFLIGVRHNHHRNDALFRDICNWCHHQYGARGKRGSWNYYGDGICFRDEVQVFEFKVRWEGTPTS